MLLIFFTLIAKGILKLSTDETFFYFLLISFILMVITSSLVHLGKNSISRNTAVILSVWFPGMGQFYLKQRLTGLLFYLLFLATCYMGTQIDIAVSTAFLVLSIFTFASALPAYLTVLTEGGKSHLGAQREAVLKYKKLAPFLEKGVIPAPDTNMLMHDGLLITAILRDSNAPLMISSVVIDELDNLKTNRDVIRRKRAQFAFDLIEMFQASGRVKIAKMPNHVTREKLNFAHTNDDKIAASYMNEFQKNKVPVVFLTNDKGARIIARNAGLPLLEIDREQTNDPNLLSIKAKEGFSTGLAAENSAGRKFTSYLPRIEVPGLGGFLRIAVLMFLAFGIYVLFDKSENASEAKGGELAAAEAATNTVWEKPDFPIAELEVTEVTIEEGVEEFSISYEIINHSENTYVFGFTESDSGSERESFPVKHADGIQLTFHDGSVKNHIGGHTLQPKEKGKVFFMANESIDNLKSVSMLIHKQETGETIEWTKGGEE
ncbi:PIN domain-containing protein [Metaplanococcus flavidus]|uniref:PIN domain-containing protein n=1 Tax=Metaplanococcus flavidus TaxID=569883 RepID=A0ABW3LBE6_9BACL